jgi:hypothetical protein
MFEAPTDTKDKGGGGGFGIPSQKLDKNGLLKFPVSVIRAITITGIPLPLGSVLP